MARGEGMWRNKGSVEKCGEWESEGMTQMVRNGCQDGKQGHSVPLRPQMRLLAGYCGELPAQYHLTLWG